MKEVFDVVKTIPQVAHDVYTDAAAKTLQEASKIGVDAVKTLRLALLPMQFTAAIQDRLSKYIDTAIRQVPEQRRICPRESLALPIAEKLRFQEENNPLSTLYVNLLSRGMDKERMGEAHPAFVNIVSQLAPDEVLLIEQLSAADYRLYFRFNNKKVTVLRSESDTFVKLMPLTENTKIFLLERLISPEALGQPALFLTFLEHLVSLGLVEYDNDPRNSEELMPVKLSYESAAFFCIKLSEFGKLFYKACIQIT